ERRGRGGGAAGAPVELRQEHRDDLVRRGPLEERAEADPRAIQIAAPRAAQGRDEPEPARGLFPLDLRPRLAVRRRAPGAGGAGLIAALAPAPDEIDRERAERPAEPRVRRGAAVLRAGAGELGEGALGAVRVAPEEAAPADLEPQARLLARVGAGR